MFKRSLSKCRNVRVSCSRADVCMYVVVYSEHHHQYLSRNFDLFVNFFFESFKHKNVVVIFPYLEYSIVKMIEVETCWSHMCDTSVCNYHMLYNHSYFCNFIKFFEERASLKQSEYGTNWSWPGSTCTKMQICQLQPPC